MESDYTHFEDAGFSFLTKLQGIEEITYIINEQTGEAFIIPTDVLNAFIAQRGLDEESGFTGSI